VTVVGVCFVIATSFVKARKSAGFVCIRLWASLQFGSLGESWWDGRKRGGEQGRGCNRGRSSGRGA
jgi:hypothetical protein